MSVACVTGRQCDDGGREEEDELGTTPQFRAHVAAKLSSMLDRWAPVYNICYYITCKFIF